VSGFDIAEALTALDEGRPLVLPRMKLARVVIHGQVVKFCTGLTRDLIQNRQRGGAFYEQDDLDHIRQYIKKDAHVLDIGSNVGNHMLYFAKIAGAQRIVVIEPNPKAIALLVGNVVVNDLLEVVDMSALGIGLSDVAAQGLTVTVPERNLGGGKLTPGGDIAVCRGDDLFGGETPDLIKIDVEGMEMKVLCGLEETIARSRPAIFVEVDNAHLAPFAEWCNIHDYQVLFEHRRYKANKNFFVSPNEKAPT